MNQPWECGKRKERIRRDFFTQNGDRGICIIKPPANEAGIGRRKFIPERNAESGPSQEGRRETRWRLSCGITPHRNIPRRITLSEASTKTSKAKTSKAKKPMAKPG